MTLECSAFTLNRCVVIEFKPIIEMKGCVPSNLRCEMTVKPLDRFRGVIEWYQALGYDLDANLFSLPLAIDG